MATTVIVQGQTQVTTRTVDPLPKVSPKVEGIQGPVGGSEGVGQNHSVQYNFDGVLSGASGFTFDAPNSTVSISGNNLTIDNGLFKITGSNSYTENVLITNGEINLLRIDTSGKKINFIENDTSSDYSIGINVENPSERVHISGANLKVDGTGYFTDLYLNELKVATEDYVRSVSGYLDEKTDFSILRTTVSNGVDNVFVNFGKTIDYTPKIFLTLIPPTDNSDIYAASVDQITTTGVFVDFSSYISETGYVLNTFVSSKFYG
jgi:hypothetical protein